MTHTLAAETPNWLTGRFLVASPKMSDPNFAETVIIMLEHHEGGARGLVVNRPLGQVPVGRLLEQLGENPPDAGSPIAVFRGGPVEPGRGFLLHSADVLSQGSRAISEDLAVTSSPEILRAMAEGRGPKNAIFVLGYAGWAPGQLDAEIAAGAWDDIPADPALIFEAPVDSRWERAMSRHGVDL